MSVSVLDNPACAKKLTASLLVIGAADEDELDEELEVLEDEEDEEDETEDFEEEALAGDDEEDRDDKELGDDDESELDEEDTVELLELADVARLDELRLDGVTEAALLELSDDVTAALAVNPEPLAPPPPQAAKDKEASAIPIPVLP